MLFIDFSCKHHPFIYAGDQYWRKFWVSIAQQYPQTAFRFVTEENIKSILPLPANCEFLFIRKSQLASLFNPEKAFSKAVEEVIPADDSSCWITNQVSHIPAGKLKHVLWVDDLEWLQFPQWQKENVPALNKVKYGKLISKVQYFIAISKNYSNILQGEFGIPENRIAIVSPVFSESAWSGSWPENENIKTRYTGGNDFFVFVGEIHDRHHLTKILKAYSVFKKWQKSSMQLVIAGNETRFTAAFIDSIASYKYRDEVVIVKNPTQVETARIVAAAYACIYTAESVDLPLTVLNAMKTGTPLITSDIPPIREIAGNSVLYAGATDETAIANNMILIYKDETLRNRLIEEGLKKVQDYSLEKAVERLASLHHSLLNIHP